MSANTFERKTAAALRKVPGLWWWHPNEPEGYHQEVPGDFLFGHARGWGLLECKQISFDRLSPSLWTAHQRNQARWVAAAGGTAWLFVSFRSGMRLFNYNALSPALAVGHVGIPVDYSWAHDIPSLPSHVFQSLILLDKDMARV